MPETWKKPDLSADQRTERRRTMIFSRHGQPRRRVSHLRQERIADSALDLRAAATGGSNAKGVAAPAIEILGRRCILRCINRNSLILIAAVVVIVIRGLSS